MHLINTNNNTFLYRNRNLFHLSRTNGGIPRLLDTLNLNLLVDRNPEFLANAMKIEHDEIDLYIISRIYRPGFIPTLSVFLPLPCMKIIIRGLLYLALKKIHTTTSRTPAAQLSAQILFRDRGVT